MTLSLSAMPARLTAGGTWVLKFSLGTTMLQGMLSALHSTQEDQEGGKEARDPYPHMREECHS